VQSAVQCSRNLVPSRFNGGALATTTPLDIATAIVAGYAALVATLALSFNVFSWLRTWQTRLKVQLQPRERVTPGAPAEQIVLFRLTNHSGHVVKSTHVGMTPIKRGGLSLMFPQPHGLPVPGRFEVPPRDSVDVWIEPARLAGGDPSHKTRAQVVTSDGKTFKSKRVRVRDLTGES
jgi:hypothetical protein